MSTAALGGGSGAMAAFVIFLLSTAASADHLPTCQPKDFHYELTECDSTAGRWRVSVPSAGSCTGGAPNAPVRLLTCTAQTCQPGDYFDMDLLDCRPCRPGTYSLGGMIRHDSWDSLPAGFASSVEPLTSRSSFSLLERQKAAHNCSRSEWQTVGDYMAFPGGPCVASLTYSLRLDKAGSIQYTYQYPDDDAIFEFQAQNEMCQSVAGNDDTRWPTVTDEGKWHSKTIELPRGLNVLQWKAMGISGRQTKPLLIKLIQVSGVAPSSACTPCRNGTYASSAGSSQCQECATNSHSPRGSSQCIPCDRRSMYAAAGSARCHKRPPCTPNDYFEVHSPCDDRNTTLVSYEWITPRMCRDDLSTAVKLPAGSERRKCPPCSPGMQISYKSGTCQFCPAGSISDGIRPCRSCPPSTAANTGVQFLWWNNLPPGMSTRCMSLEGTQTGSGCTTTSAWLPSGDHMRTSQGHATDAYLILSLKIEKGFRGAGSVSFTFQLDCKGQCQLVFMQSSPAKGVSVIETWSGRTPRQYFTYRLPQNGSYTFNWAFQKQGWSQDAPVRMRVFSDSDVARLYSVNVTNTAQGGASVCLPCAQGSDASGCIPCPLGHFTQGSQCARCPANTVVVDQTVVGKSACVQCGPGLVTSDHKTCTTDCTPSVNGTRYDLRKIGSGYREVRGSRLFTASGMQYFHVFNISLCGKEPVNCANNITFQTEGEPKSVMALICRTTLIPSQNQEDSSSGPLSTQSVTLGDHLIGMTTQSHLGDMRVLDEFWNAKDLHVFYGTPTATKSCPKGRTTTVTLRCDGEQPGQGQVTLPSHCPDGTCDGCHFHFLWTSQSVCPICGPQDIKVVKSECSGGQQNVHYLAPKHCLMPEDMPALKTNVCSTQIPFVLQVMIMGSIAVALLLCLTVFYCWKRNRRLEYKYMKLARNRAAPCEKEQPDECETNLTAAESCALDDDEDEDDISVTVPVKNYGLVNKIRSMANPKSETGSPFETIQLTEAQS